MCETEEMNRTNKQDKKKKKKSRRITHFGHSSKRKGDDKQKTLTFDGVSPGTSPPTARGASRRSTTCIVSSPLSQPGSAHHRVVHSLERETKRAQRDDVKKKCEWSLFLPFRVFGGKNKKMGGNPHQSFINYYSLYVNSLGSLHRMALKPTALYLPSKVCTSKVKSSAQDKRYIPYKWRTPRVGQEPPSAGHRNM